MTQIFLGTLVGFLTGIISGLFGVGGGIIIIPSLIFLGLPIHQAISNSLFYITIIMLSGVFQQYRNKNINFHIAIPTALASVIFAQIGIKILNKMDSNNLQLYFGIFLFLIGIDFVRKVFDKRNNGLEDIEIQNKKYKIKDYLISFTIGIFGGLCAGLFGVGGGVILIPMYNNLLKMPIKLSIGTSSFVIFFAAFSGSITHIFEKNISFHLLTPMVIFGLLGTIIGIFLLNKSKDLHLKVGFGFIILSISCLLIFKSLL